MDQLEIISRCQTGDLCCFEELYRIYSKKALGTAYIISGNRGIAEDIVQEAFVLCYRNIKSLKNPETFNVWFYRILVRVGWRMASKYKPAEFPGEVALEMNNGNVQNLAIESVYESSCNRLLMREAVKKLKLPFKTVIILYYFNEMSIKDISKIVGCRQGTVKSRLHKARRLLQKELRPYFTPEFDRFELYGKEQEANG